MEEIKTLSFFGESGLTSTSANHIANLAKEYVRSCQEKLAAVTFYDENIKLIGQSESTLVHSGINKTTLDYLPEVVKTIAEAHSLIAFLREAIKEKERKMREAEVWTDKEQDAELQREWIALNSPVKEAYPTEESVRQTWSIGEQEHYLSLQAEAAALGKFIHEDSPMSNARITLMRKMENPSSVQLNGADTIVHTYTPSVNLDDVNEVFNSLQKRHREVQAELNGMKKKVDDYIADKKAEIDTRYLLTQRLYNQQEYQYKQKERLYKDERDMKRCELEKQVRDLKIVIPNRLRPIYEILTK